MSLRFVLGRAGTGKTRRCLEEIREAALAEPQGSPLVLLVPEQATFQMEQALLRSEGLAGMMRAQVLSFQRLAWRVSMSAGGLAKPPLSDLGKQMLLRALVEKRVNELRIFDQVADRPGFIAKIASTISELRSYNLGPEALQQQLEALTRAGADQGTLGSKLHDLALIMADLTAYTADKFTDPDEYLTVLAQRLPQSGLLDGAEVWIDSFTGFTPQEMDVLRVILTSARRTHITLTLDPDELVRMRGRHKETDLFHPILSTYEQLEEMVAELGVEQEESLLCEDVHRLADSPDLAHLERNLLRSGMARKFPGETPAITLASAQNRRQEAEAAAREVLRLSRDLGYRFREIAVVTRNLDAYGDLLSTVFDEHGIPAFIDRRRTVAHHPLVELLRAALDVVIQDWAYGPVFRYLKTDLAPVYRDQVDLLENYVLEHGIRGRRWHDAEPWMFVRLFTLEDEQTLTPGSQRMLERVNLVRNKAAAELTAFHRRLGGGRGGKPRTVKSITTAIFSLLDDLKVSRRLEEWSDRAEAAGELEEAREHEQVWEDVLELLDQMVESMGDAEMNLTQYQQVLSAGLDGLRLGLIPPGLDQVVIGSVERSRHSGLKAALILGATERDFPPLPPEDAVFNDREREDLAGAGILMGPTSKLRLFQEQYFTYVALTRASHRLWISHPMADEQGRVLSPSPVVGRLKQVFPDLKEISLGGESGEAVAQAIATPAQLAAALTRALRTHRSGYPLDPVWLDLYQWTVQDPHLRDQVAPTLSALHYEESFQERTASLGPETALQLYGGSLVTSVSRLESFMICPFQHFAGHGLRLKERAQFQVSAPELGMFYHAAMSLFVRQLAEDSMAWESLTPAQAAERMDQVIDLLAPKLQSEILLSSPQHRYLLRVLRRTVQASLGYLGEHVYQGGFRPLWVELPFGEAAFGVQTPDGTAVDHAPPASREIVTPSGIILPGGSLPAVEIPVDGHSMVQLRGRIDRVDGYRSPGGDWYLRVMDYKSSARNLDLGRFYAGLALQLPLYLYAVILHAQTLLQAPALPGGALYFPVHDPIERLLMPQAPEKIAQLRLKRFKATGLVNADPEIIRQMDPGGIGLIQTKLNKDGSVRRNTPAATSEQFGLVFRHLERTVGQASRRLLQGEVDVAPAKTDNLVPCDNCSYRPVCQFDPLVPGQGYRPIKLMKSADVWAKLEEEGGGENE